MVGVHDPPLEYDRTEETRKPTKMLLTFHCGRAEVATKEAVPKLVPVPWGPDRRYRLVSRVRSITGLWTEESHGRSPIHDVLPVGHVQYAAILEAEIPLWSHFWTKGDDGIEAGSTIDVSGRLMVGPC